MTTRPTAVIFDFDGTIVDTEWSEFVTIAAEMEHHGVTYTLDDHRGRVGLIDGGHWSDELVRRVGDVGDLDDVIRRRRAAHAGMLKTEGLRAGVASLFDAAVAASIPMAVASSSPLDWVGPHLDERGLAEHFGAIVTGDQVERRKPWPDVFIEAARRLDVAPDRCLVIEDSAPGVAAAKAAGMTCVAVPNDVTAGSDFAAADCVLSSLADLPAIHLGF